MARQDTLFRQIPIVAKERRKELKLSQKELGRLARVSASTVSRIEKGKGTSPDNLDSVFTALGLGYWLPALTTFARSAQHRARYAYQDQLAESNLQAPIVLRLVPGDAKSVAFEVQTGHRRLLCVINLYDYTPHLQEDLFPGG